ncbi:uncharacterized protein SAPINGB_P002775 [Magnusiomyces paraingens]|uniref:CCA tRNA nucleotidyltransferase, mitochondrial n=1 Tax=Magnusiomyces paraingens TaxID=2606893 RepID=A0A5E8BNX7_9ASCO|nr:uncharacterized protein SAPINGB_P002775 [Saprochaete ingens]VVT50473.1 unnamed protein product [Saprochaete ingens]
MSFSIPYTKINPEIYRPGETVKLTLQLTDQEQKIRDLVVLYCKYYNETKKNTSQNINDSSEPTEPLIARITGGWVRDKLLGRQSHDIDIAINSLTGLDFAEGMIDYILTHGDVLTEHGLGPIEPRSIHKIERNPEKSKHLETATTKLYDLFIDIVNLRSEEYAEDSRIPTIMTFGTAEQDAFRRDATVNALFYNLQENCVEDLTGRGLQDLRDGIIRTPLPPFETFNDDPLRVLRLIRFASTFGFQIASETLDAMSDPRIKEALMLKISRERVGVELAKALTSTRPQVCLMLLHYLNLHNAVFYLPEGYHPKNITGSKSVELPEDNSIEAVASAKIAFQKAHPYLAQQIAGPQPGTSESESTIATAKKLHFWLALALNHLEGILGATDKPRESPLIALAAARIIRVGVKLSSHDADTVARCHLAHSQDLSYFGVPSSKLTGMDYVRGASRKELGLLVRKCGQQWGLLFYYCLVKDLTILYERTGLAQELSEREEEPKGTAEVLEFYHSLVERIITELGLADAWALKPILNGKDVQSVFGAKKGGPWLTNALAALIELQLENPDTTKDSAKAYLLENKSKLYPE